MIAIIPSGSTLPHVRFVDPGSNSFPVTWLNSGWNVVSDVVLPHTRRYDSAAIGGSAFKKWTRAWSSLTLPSTTRPVFYPLYLITGPCLSKWQQLASGHPRKKNVALISQSDWYTDICKWKFLPLKLFVANPRLSFSFCTYLSRASSDA